MNMKAGAFILAVILGILLVQPIFGNIRTRVANSSCAKPRPVESSCCKSKCSKPEPANDQNDCSGDRCNPFMGCPAGNFYVHNYFSLSLTSLIILNGKTIPFDDNRVLKQLSECWHPPEVAS
jgi:hypothetical protein